MSFTSWRMNRLPDSEAYEGFPMLENGVGMVQDFLSEPLSTLPVHLPQPKKIISSDG